MYQTPPLPAEPPIDRERVTHLIQTSGLNPVGMATIRELTTLVNKIEQACDCSFVRMEMGVPGLDAPQIGIQAEIDALQSGVASKYPSLEGIPALKQEISRFCKQFMNVDVNPQGCLPTVGSMQGSAAAFMLANRTHAERNGTLFIDPGFPIQKKQLQALNQTWGSFDVYEYRGEKLRAELERQLREGNFSSILYSNPNNPSWICFTHDELKIIGELATKYDVIVIEDLAYFGMDFRNDYSKPGVAPYQPTVAHYTDNYIFLISSSKAFSYAGQRVASLVVSDSLYARQYPNLQTFYNNSGFGYSMIFGALYTLSCGVTHSAQYGLAAMLKAANDGQFNFIGDTQIYGIRAKRIKQLFIENGFKLVYDQDNNLPLADGFYFTFSYPGFDGNTLAETLLYYGISAITIQPAGSNRTEGLRACVSQIAEHQIPDLEHRLQQFHAHHPHSV